MGASGVALDGARRARGHSGGLLVAPGCASSRPVGHFEGTNMSAACKIKQTTSKLQYARCVGFMGHLGALKLALIGAIIHTAPSMRAGLWTLRVRLAFGSFGPKSAGVCSLAGCGRPVADTRGSCQFCCIFPKRPRQHTPLLTCEECRGHLCMANGQTPHQGPDDGIGACPFKYLS